MCLSRLTILKVHTKPPLLIDAHWYVVEHILTFIELFYDLSVTILDFV